MVPCCPPPRSVYIHCLAGLLGLFAFVGFYSSDGPQLWVTLSDPLIAKAMLIAATIVVAQILATMSVLHWFAGDALRKRMALLRCDGASCLRATSVGLPAGVALGGVLIALSAWCCALDVFPPAIYELAVADRSGYVAAPWRTVAFGALYAALMDHMCIRASAIVAISAAIEAVARRLRILLLRCVDGGSGGGGCCRQLYERVHPDGSLRSPSSRWWLATLVACIVNIFVPTPGRVMGLGALSGYRSISWYQGWYSNASTFTAPLIAYYIVGCVIHGAALSALSRRWGFEAGAVAAGACVAIITGWDVAMQGTEHAFVWMRVMR